MKKFEYNRVDIFWSDFSDSIRIYDQRQDEYTDMDTEQTVLGVLNDYGQQGWELVSAVILGDGDAIYYFKQEIVDG